MHQRLRLVALIAVAALSGCVTTDAVLLDSGRSYAPTDSAEILSERPTRPFVEIAVIESTGPVNAPTTKLLRDMRKRAQSLGAHAVIPVQGETKQTQPTLMYNPLLGGYQTLGGSSIPVLRGVAIRYTDQ
jgi:hypothetical protein